MVPLNKALQWVNVKQKPFRPIMAHSGIIKHIQELFRHIQPYLEPCLTLTYLKLVYPKPYYEQGAYSEPRHIHNPAVFRTPLYSER